MRTAGRDRVHLAACLEAGIEEILGPDHGFDTVPGLRRLDPAVG